MPEAYPPRRAQVINIAGASNSPLSSAQILDGVIYASGQVGRDHATGLIPSDLTGQVQQALSNLQDVLQAAGGSLSTVLKTTVFLTRSEDFAPMNEVYAGYFPEAKPARSTVIVAALANPAYLFEIEAIAYQRDSGQP